MLKFDADSKNAKLLAIHYARLIGGDLLIKFMSGETDLSNTENATLIIKGFWQMTDLAIKDNHANKIIEGITDIEFWMHKLFIKVNGYMTRNGFKTLWDASINNR
ncbi:MAG TPA: hypothetical protein VIZ65_01815 [Cellvibrionaceae bacterium]